MTEKIEGHAYEGLDSRSRPRSGLRECGSAPRRDAGARSRRPRRRRAARARPRPDGAPWARRVALALTLGAGLPGGLTAQEGYDPASTGTRAFEIGPIAVKVLVEAANLGGDEVEIVEMTFPPGGPRSGGDHRHGRVEIFYVLEGTMEHVVNGEAHVLEPGTVGIVRPEDTVAHRVLSEEPVRTLVIWAPGGELRRFAPPSGPSDASGG